MLLVIRPMAYGLSGFVAAMMLKDWLIWQWLWFVGLYENCEFVPLLSFLDLECVNSGLILSCGAFLFFLNAYSSVVPCISDDWAN